MKRSHPWAALLGFSAAVAGAAWFGSRFSPRRPKTEEWYRGLDKPPYNPPNAVFPIVWPVLYTLMTTAGWRVWRQPGSARRTWSLALWAAQIPVNAAWTYFFFGRQAPVEALADNFLLEGLLLGFIVAAEEIDRPAAACFVPYAAWVGFAVLLNAEIVRRNPKQSF